MAMREYLFHQKRFVYRDGDEGVYSFESEHAGIDFYDEGKSLRSIPRSTFGGFFLAYTATVDDAIRVLNSVENFARERHKEEIWIRNMPYMYSPPLAALIQQTLELAGYEKAYTDIDYVLEVNGPHLESMNRLRRKKLVRAKGNDLVFQWLPASYLPMVYQQLEATRLRKGYVMSMTLEEVQRMMLVFPNEYIIAGVFSEDVLVASALIIVVSSTIWYVLYWGDDIRTRKNSPITFLANSLFNEAYLKGVSLLDLGTASHQGVLNDGVSFFKTSLGALPNNMITWKKRLSHES